MSKSNIAARRGRPADPQARAKRRSQILEAAHRCFARKGFHLTTAAEISAEAEISVAGLYRYFPSKDDLILALIELDLAESVGLIEVLMASENFFDGAESILLLAMQDERQQAMSRLRLEIIAEASRKPEIAEIAISCDQRFTTAMVRAVTLAQAKGQIASSVDPYELTIAFNCIMDGLFGRICLPGYARAQLVTACVDMMRRAAVPI